MQRCAFRKRERHVGACDNARAAAAGLKIGLRGKELDGGVGDIIRRRAKDADGPVCVSYGPSDKANADNVGGGVVEAAKGPGPGRFQIGDKIRKDRGNAD